MIEKIRAADRIGILIGTLAVASYADIIDSVQTLIEASDKRAHVVVVGKLNPAKLGNFMEIEVFVNVACPENSLVDGRDFLQPIVTPFELYLALQPSAESNDEASAVYERYILDFRRLLDDFRECNAAAVVEEEREEKEEQLISGQLTLLNVGSNLPMVQLNHKQSALSVIDRRTAGGPVQRSWWGLDMKEADQKQATKASEGRSGVARGYLGESVSYE